MYASNLSFLTLLHLQHAFPHDYRSGPSLSDWDPSKWAILCLHAMGLVSGLKRARPEDVSEALTYMSHKKENEGPGHLIAASSDAEPEDEWFGEVWTWVDVEEYVRAGRDSGRCVIVIDGFVVDVTGYLGQHVRYILLLLTACCMLMAVLLILVDHTSREVPHSYANTPSVRMPTLVEQTV